MSIKEFEYLDKVIYDLNKDYDELNSISESIETIFSSLLAESALEFLNVNSRVKSPESLREKILRNKYYKKYPNPNLLLYNLSDLIGVRIECRFSDDEKSIYKYLKKYFNKKSGQYYFFNESNPNFFLKFQGKQPQKQKNGFTIYRIDGRFLYNNQSIPFELQIKSLVNMFWGEIEHQVIYKNSNYIIEDRFLKDIMASIKNNLSMIDKQLLTVFNHFEAKKRLDNNSRKKHLEDLVSKMVYDVFSNKMKDSIGMVVDFKNSCETIVRYTFSITADVDNDQYTQLLIDALNRINEISNEPVHFNSKISFERDVYFKDTFSKVIGTYLIQVMNNEFNWNLFFKILFTLEPLNNVRDFEKFLAFLKSTYTESANLTKFKNLLEDRFKDDFSLIEELINNEIAVTLVSIDKIDIVFDFNIFEVNDALENIYKYMVDNIDTIGSFRENEAEIITMINEDILSIF